jgi:TolB-like protein
MKAQAPQRFAFDVFVLDMERGSLTRAGRPVAVGQKGLLLLYALVRQANEIVPRSTLMDAAWSGMAVEESNLSVQIAALRKLLGPQPNGSEWIATVPRVGYRFAGTARVLADNVSEITWPPSASAERPAIAVLPFANLSDDHEQAYLADGIAEDVITALTRYRWFRVVGRNSSFAYRDRPASSVQVGRELGVGYVLEGSLRRSADVFRVTARLIEAGSASQIWADCFAVELADVFAVQDAIAERVAGAIEPELLRTESLPTAARHTGNVTAWDLVRQGMWQFHHVAQETHRLAREAFREAARQDPELAEAHVWIGRVNAGLVAYGWTQTPSDDIGEGLDAALQAVRLDERNPYSHYALAICSAYANAPEQAVLAAERAVELNPSFALGHLVLGMAHLFRGSPSEAIASLEHGLLLNPHDPQNFVWLNLLANAHLLAKRPDDALAAAVRALKVRPSWRPIYETLILCHVSLGSLADARSYRVRMQDLEATIGDALSPLRARNPQWAAEMADLLMRSG